MTEQAERLLKLEGESRGVDICGPKWPEHGTETQIGGGLESSNSILLQRFSRVERVTGIEPALPAWSQRPGRHPAGLCARPAGVGCRGCRRLREGSRTRRC